MTESKSNVSPILISVIIVSIIVVIPLLILVFLNAFGNNRYTLPVYFAEDSVMTEQGEYKISSAHSVPAFAFTSQYGTTFDSRVLNNKIWVANFIFTRCPGICPKMTTQLTRVQEAMDKDTSVKIVSFTVDPNFDTAEVLKVYAESFNADERWTFLTGEKEKIYELGQKGFYITTKEDTARPLEFLHSDKLVLVDKKGWIRGYYNGTDQEEVDKLITEIKVLQEIYGQEK